MLRTVPQAVSASQSVRSKPVLNDVGYLVKIYVDLTGKLQKDFKKELGKDDFIDEVEVTSRWPSGYGRMAVVKFPAR